MKVHSIETFGTGEGPGIRLVVFLQGCQLRCLYCHNADTQECGGGREMSVEEIVALLEKQRPYFAEKGGLTLSGGEPLVQAEALIPLLQKCREKGFHTCLCTNGGILNEAVKALLEETDLVLLDIKQMNPERHRTLTGGENEVPLAFAQYLREIQKPFGLRYVVVPGYTDDESDLHALGKYFAEYENLAEVTLLPYHTLGVHKYAALGREYALSVVKSPTPAHMQAIKDLLKNYFKSIIIR